MDDVDNGEDGDCGEVLEDNDGSESDEVERPVVGATGKGEVEVEVGGGVEDKLDVDAIEVLDDSGVDNVDDACPFPLPFPCPAPGVMEAGLAPSPSPSSSSRSSSSS
jgi:hypothetical protein